MQTPLQALVSILSLQVSAVVLLVALMISGGVVGSQLCQSGCHPNFGCLDNRIDVSGALKFHSTYSLFNYRLSYYPIYYPGTWSRCVGRKQAKVGNLSKVDEIVSVLWVRTACLIYAGRYGKGYNLDRRLKTQIIHFVTTMAGKTVALNSPGVAKHWVLTYYLSKLVYEFIHTRSCGWSITLEVVLDGFGFKHLSIFSSFKKKRLVCTFTVENNTEVLLHTTADQITPWRSGMGYYLVWKPLGNQGYSKDFSGARLLNLGAGCTCCDALRYGRLSRKADAYIGVGVLHARDAAYEEREELDGENTLVLRSRDVP